MEYEHIVRLNSDEQRFELFRIFSDGNEVLYTHVPLQSNKGVDRSFKKVAHQLGECLLLDMEIGRKLL